MATICYICHGLGSDAPKLGIFSDVGVRFDELSAAVRAGCTACSLLLGGILSFVSPQHIRRIDAYGSVETRRDSRLGQRLPLLVRAHLDVGITRLEFYRSNASFNQWPLIPIAPHISAESSSGESFGLARKWLDHCVKNHPTGLCSPKIDRALSNSSHSSG